MILNILTLLKDFFSFLLELDMYQIQVIIQRINPTVG
jgi:hypothetical protein